MMNKVEARRLIIALGITQAKKMLADIQGDAKEIVDSHYADIRVKGPHEASAEKHKELRQKEEMAKGWKNVIAEGEDYLRKFEAAHDLREQSFEERAVHACILRGYELMDGGANQYGFLFIKNKHTHEIDAIQETTMADWIEQDKGEKR